MLQLIIKGSTLLVLLLNQIQAVHLPLSASVVLGGPNSEDKLSSPLRVAYQGEPGAYSEKSTRELLGTSVTTVGYSNFEACYRAVVEREADFACLPVENSLGGSIHENYDLMLRYDLTIVAEHDFRVQHNLIARNGVKKSDIKYAMSHPQALAQCDNYFRANGITPIPAYDTAGSAKMLSEGKLPVTASSRLPMDCTLENTAAIASDLAAKTYNLNILQAGIEDDSSNFTRFLLLGRKGVSQHLKKDMPAKTSIVFTLPNSAGALYKALACFSLRDIDFSKIESRPTSANLLQYLKYRSQVTQQGTNARSTVTMPRFRYCFYLDFLAGELDENAQNALHHLKEQASFCRILGSYPQKSKLVGPVKDAVATFKDSVATGPSLVSDEEEPLAKKLKIGIVGYGKFGRFLGKKMTEWHQVSCTDTVDRSLESEEDGVEYYPQYDMAGFLQDLDVVVLAVPLIQLEEVVLSLPMDRLEGKLVVEVCNLSTHPKKVLLKCLPPSTDVICSIPLFGPSDASVSNWDGLPFVYENVRISKLSRAVTFLGLFQKARCRVLEMPVEEQDGAIADTEFITHLTGRLLDRSSMPPTMMSSKEYAALLDVADMTAEDSFDVFYGMFKFNDKAKGHLNKMRDNLAKLERQLAAKEAYLIAKSELESHDRQRLLNECRILLKELAQDSKENNSNSEKTSNKPKKATSGRIRPSGETPEVVLTTVVSSSDST